MYCFYIKKPNTTRSLYTPYIEEDAIWKTSDLTELATKYKEIIQKYSMEQVKVIHELDPDMVVTFED